MLVSLLLTAALAGQTPPPGPAGLAAAPQVAPAPVPTHAAAAALAEVGDLDGSLRAFQQIASANPDDHEARLAIAFLHERMGHPDRAEPVYRSVLLENPSELRATIGLGSTLVARRAYDEAIDILEPAERADPQNADVQLLLGRAYASSGREARSLSYLNRAISLDPSDENRRTLERARFAYDHRFELTALSEQFGSGVADTQGADAAVNVRLSDVVRLSGRGQWERKFGRRDQRAGAGLEWRVKPMTSLLVHGLVGLDNEVLPQNEWYVAIDHASGPADWGVGYRFLDFLGARASVFGPTVLWQATERVAIDARYALVVSEFSTLVDATTEQTALLRASCLVRPRLTVMAGYARGIENFDAVSIDRLGEFGANTVSAGLRIDFPTLTSLLGSYEFQWRPDDISMQRFTVTFHQRF